MSELIAGCSLLTEPAVESVRGGKGVALLGIHYSHRHFDVGWGGYCMEGRGEGGMHVRAGEWILCSQEKY